MTRFLLDANLSPETRLHLASSLGLDVIDLMTEGLYQLSDEEVVSLAKAQNRVIITFDLDFGEILPLQGKGTAWDHYSAPGGSNGRVGQSGSQPILQQASGDD